MIFEPLASCMWWFEHKRLSKPVLFCRPGMSYVEASNFMGASVRAYELVSDAVAMDSISKEYGTEEEVRSAHEILERSLKYSLEDINEADITRGLEQGELSESDATFALKHKRQLALEEVRR